jgi:hypothetical protein
VRAQEIRLFIPGMEILQRAVEPCLGSKQEMLRVVLVYCRDGDGDANFAFNSQ